MTELRTQLEQPVGSKSLIVNSGARIFSLQKDKDYINLTVPPGIAKKPESGRRQTRPRGCKRFIFETVLARAGV